MPNYIILVGYICISIFVFFTLCIINRFLTNKIDIENIAMATFMWPCFSIFIVFSPVFLILWLGEFLYYKISGLHEEIEPEKTKEQVDAEKEVEEILQESEVDYGEDHRRISV